MLPPERDRMREEQRDKKQNWWIDINRKCNRFYPRPAVAGFTG